MTESKQRRKRPIVSDKIDKASTAYHIVVTHLGGLTEAARIADRSTNTVYGWLLRGRIAGPQQENLSDKAAEAGKPFPFEWFLRVPEDAASAPAEAA